MSIAINSGSWYQHLIRQQPAIPIAPIDRFEVYNTLIEAHPIIIDLHNIQPAYPNLALQVLNISDIILNSVIGLVVENIEELPESPVLFVEGKKELLPPEIFSVEHL